MNLNNEIIPPGCKVKYTQKVYYQKYRTKITLEIDKTKLVKRNIPAVSYWAHRYDSWENRRDLTDALLYKIKRAIPEGVDYRLRHECNKISVFTNDLDTIENVLVACSTRVIELEHPSNDKHADLIDNHRKVIVRPNLFIKRFKFKITFKHDYELRLTRYKDLQEYLENSGMDWDVNSCLNKMFKTQKNIRFIGYTMAVYLNDVDDLMMFQLRYNNQIQKIEEIVLLDSLTNE